MAKQFDSGVLNYTITSTDITVAFPEQEVKCQWCPFVRHNDGLNRNRCALTEEILFSLEITGHRCPLTIINYVKAEDLEK